MPSSAIWYGTMSRTNIAAMAEQEKILTTLLVNTMNPGVTNNGAPYVSFTLQDKTGTIEAKLWDAKEDMLEGVKPGSVILVNGEVLRYKGVLQLRLYSLSLVKADETNPADYVASTPLTDEYMRQRISESLKSIQDPIIRQVSEKVLGDYEDKFYTYPAAARNHHDFVGGLATHVIAMIDLANAFCELYPSLNRDLLISGILLHDLGKVVELSGPILTEYTLVGKLVGHISIMQSKVNQVAEALGVADTEQVTLIRHLILSHHGEYEYGSPVLPLIMEAEILNYIDNIDARMNMFSKALGSIEEGNFTGRIFALENRMFYKPKTTKK
jgi:3'-5' exoribonuclease